MVAVLSSWEPLLIIGLIIAVVLALGRNGLSLPELLAWHIDVGVTAALVALAYELLMRLDPISPATRA